MDSKNYLLSTDIEKAHKNDRIEDATDFAQGGHFFSALRVPCSAAIAQNSQNKGSADFYLIEDIKLQNFSFETSDTQQKIVLEDQYAILCWALSVLSAAPTARKMIDEAISEGWSLGLKALNGHDFHIDVPEKLILLDTNGLLISALGRSEYFCNTVLISLARALRDVWQEKRYGGFDEVYGPEAILTLERVRAADLDVLAVMIAWELRGENFGGLWRHMMGSQDCDIAMRYSGHLERDPASAYNGKALQACFKQWFHEPARINACDHETLNMLDDLIRLNEGAYEAFGCKKLGEINVEMLSCLPDRTAYLQGFGGEILVDPLYAGMNDQVNQSHLVQILHDAKAVRMHDIPFRSVELAAKIFPNGQFTAESDGA